MPGGMTLLNCNNRPSHWAGRNDPTQNLREAACKLAKAGKVPRLARARIICYVCMTGEQRFDPGNFYLSAKPCVDGFVDAGILPDDSADYVTGPLMYRGYPSPLQHLELVIDALPPAVRLSCRSLKAAGQLAEMARGLDRAAEDDYVKADHAAVVIITRDPGWAEAIREAGAIAGLLAVDGL